MKSADIILYFWLSFFLLCMFFFFFFWPVSSTTLNFVEGELTIEGIIAAAAMEGMNPRRVWVWRTFSCDWTPEISDPQSISCPASATFSTGRRLCFSFHSSENPNEVLLRPSKKSSRLVSKWFGYALSAWWGGKKEKNGWWGGGGGGGGGLKCDDGSYADECRASHSLHSDRFENSILGVAGFDSQWIESNLREKLMDCWRYSCKTDKETSAVKETAADRYIFLKNSYQYHHTETYGGEQLQLFFRNFLFAWIEL